MPIKIFKTFTVCTFISDIQTINFQCKSILLYYWNLNSLKVIDIVDNIEIIVQVQFCVQSVLRRAGRETVPLSLLHGRLQEVLAPEAAHPLPHRFSSSFYYKFDIIYRVSLKKVGLTFRARFELFRGFRSKTFSKSHEGFYSQHIVHYFYPLQIRLHVLV